MLKTAFFQEIRRTAKAITFSVPFMLKRATRQCSSVFLFGYVFKYKFGGIIKEGIAK